MKRILTAAVLAYLSVFGASSVAYADDDEEGIAVPYFYVQPTYYDLKFAQYSGAGSLPQRSDRNLKGEGGAIGLQITDVFALEGFFGTLKDKSSGTSPFRSNEVDLYGARLRATAPMFDGLFALHGILEYSQFDDDDYDFENSKFGYGFGIAFTPMDFLHIGGDWVQHKDNKDSDSNSFRIYGGNYYVRFNIPLGGGGDDDDDDDY